MKSSQPHAQSEHHKARRPQRQIGAALALASAVTGLSLLTTACSGSVVHNYRTFHSALERGASCSELFDQRERFSDPDTLIKVDRALAAIGCISRDSVRNGG